MYDVYTQLLIFITTYCSVEYDDIEDVVCVLCVCLLSLISLIIIKLYQKNNKNQLFLQKILTGT